MDKNLIITVLFYSELDQNSVWIRHRNNGRSKTDVFNMSPQEPLILLDDK